METTSHRVKDMIYISFFAIIIGICAWISITAVIPFTLQTFGVFLTISVLGGKRGTLAIIVYLLLGMIGIPVYATGLAGIGILFGKTGGYMISWIFIGLIMWAMERIFGKKTWVQIVSMFFGLLLCYTFGTLWYYYLYASELGQVGIRTILGWCVIHFIIPDLIKIALAIFVQKRLVRFID